MRRGSAGRPTLNVRTALLTSTVAVTVLVSSCAPSNSQRLRIATTTSIQHSGLLDELLPRFHVETGVDIQVAPVGSGIALDMLKRRDVALVISHAPAREAELLRTPGAWLYRKIMFNDFVLVGPPADPAQVKGAGTVQEAMRRIASSGRRFISRGDSSGTHERELELWKRADAALEPR